MKWQIFDILINLFQGFMMFYFVFKKLKPVYTGILPALAVTILTGAFLTCHSYFEWEIPDTFVFLIPLGYSLICSRMKWYIILLWNAVLAMLVVGITDLIANLHMSIYASSWEQIMQDIPLRMMCTVIINAFILLAVYLITRRTKHDTSAEMIPTVVITCTELIDLGIAEVLFSLEVHVEGSHEYLLYAGMGLLFVSLMQIVLYERFAYARKEIDRNKAMVASLETTNRYIADIKSIYTACLAQQHDIRKQLELAKSLYAVNRGAGEKLPDIRIPGPEFMTGNVAVDALLTVKKAAMEKEGIVMATDPYPLAGLPLDESVLCTILNNLLENAMEAVQRIKDRRPAETRDIRLSFLRVQDNFFITCRNRMDPDTLHRDGSRFITSKDNKALHGYGIENIRRLTEENGGNSSFTVNGNVFSAEITLPLR